MARKCSIHFTRDPKDNIHIAVEIDTGQQLTEDEIKNDPMLTLVYQCLQPVFPYVKSTSEKKENE